MTREEMVWYYLCGVMRGSQDDRAHAKAVAEDVKRHGPIKRIVFRVGNTITVYELEKPKRSRRR